MVDRPSRASFRDAMAHFASGVTVVTAHTERGPAGFTATAFSSVSLAPPLILVCISQGASAHDAVVGARFFGVNVLADRQARVAEQFARSGIDRFEGVALRTEEDEKAPLLEGALVQLECRQAATYTAGDHTILIGEVERAWVGAGRPLVHFARRFGGFALDGPQSGGSGDGAGAGVSTTASDA
jgi:flavin reductase ActVB